MIEYSISVVVLVYNEEANIKNTIEKLVPLLTKNFSDYEIIMVESGSTDRSGIIVDQIAKRNDKIRVIHQQKKMGYGNAIRTGLKECKSDLSIYIDCDLPYDFKYFIDAAQQMKNYDAVIAYKVGKRESFRRKVLSFGTNFLAKMFFGVKVRDVGFPFKMIRTDLVKKFSLVSNNSFAPVEILLELKKHKARIKEIAVPYHMREEGESKFANIRVVIAGHLLDIFNYTKKRFFLTRSRRVRRS